VGAIVIRDLRAHVAQRGHVGLVTGSSVSSAPPARLPLPVHVLAHSPAAEPHLARCATAALAALRAAGYEPELVVRASREPQSAHFFFEPQQQALALVLAHPAVPLADRTLDAAREHLGDRLRDAPALAAAVRRAAAAGGKVLASAQDAAVVDAFSILLVLDAEPANVARCVQAVAPALTAARVD